MYDKLKKIKIKSHKVIVFIKSTLYTDYNLDI